SSDVIVKLHAARVHRVDREVAGPHRSPELGLTTQTIQVTVAEVEFALHADCPGIAPGLKSRLLDQGTRPFELGTGCHEGEPPVGKPSGASKGGRRQSSEPDW